MSEENEKNNQENDASKTEVILEEDQETGQNGVVLISDVLPEQVFLLPSGTKPVFPGLVFPLLLSDPHSRAAQVVRKVSEENGSRLVGIVLTRYEMESFDAADSDDGDPFKREDLYEVGTVARVLRMEQSHEGQLHVLLQGQQRCEIRELYQAEGLTAAKVKYMEDVEEDSEEVRASAMAIIKSMRELMKHNPVYSEEIRAFLSRADWREPGRLADFAATMTAAGREELQEVLEQVHIRKRLENVLFLLRKELDLNELKERITKQIEEKISKQQREFFLREQLRAIKEELGMEKDEKTEEVQKYRDCLEELDLPDEAYNTIEEQVTKLELLSPQSPEFSVVRTYLDWLVKLPWNKFGRDKLDVKRAESILNKDHYGLEDVKKRILEFIAVAKMKGEIEGSILCFIGPPGVGKTSLGKSIARALNREFFRFSLGGIRDEAEIKGHRRTYIGALPGKVMQAINNVGTSNPVIMLDEIDKIGASFQGDPASALLEVLDPEQNAAFRDHYLDVPFDLSKVLFIATANVPDTIPGPLLDRMEVIRLSGYIEEEKVAIAKRFLVPRALGKQGLTKDDARFTEGGLKVIINGHAREAGVRALEKSVNTCLRKVAMRKAMQEEEGQEIISHKNVKEYLGKPRFSDDPLVKTMKPGLALGLAWTTYGGETLYIEAIRRLGSKEMMLTGQLGDVMSESMQIAFSLVRSWADRFGIDPEFFEKNTIHVHVPAGATPKDGPSAGITIVTALLSLARNQCVPKRLVMTGEITLAGRVLAVGGIKEKVIAAKRAKATHVILPEDNEKDFVEIPEKIRDGVTVHYVRDYKEVFKLVFDSDLK